MNVADRDDLERFVTAQEPVFAAALAELRAGRKRTHWMWFIFPQLRGLGCSETASFYGLASLDEARAYLAHTLLGPRLERCTNAVLGIEGRTVHEIFGSPDDMKFHSSMTLFAIAANGAGGETASPYQDALGRWFQGTPDPRTLRLLGVTREAPGR
jgi:uncharacterized protein (DUF1810 family)